MKERPIIFNGEMVRAILEGRKTQTRRVCKWLIDKPWVKSVYPARDHGWIGWDHYDSGGLAELTKFRYPEGIDCPHGKPGDCLWVRETWTELIHGEKAIYFADARSFSETITWTPSIFMPRWASRITLDITGVRVEKLQNITHNDACVEGAPSEPDYNNFGTGSIYIDWFAETWNSLNAKRGYSWDSNPWVWVIEFKQPPSPIQ